MLEKVNDDNQIFILPQANKIRICVGDESVYKDMTIDSYFNLLFGLLDAIQEMRRKGEDG